MPFIEGTADEPHELRCFAKGCKAVVRAEPPGRSSAGQAVRALRRLARESGWSGRPPDDRCPDHRDWVPPRPLPYGQDVGAGYLAGHLRALASNIEAGTALGGSITYVRIRNGARPLYRVEGRTDI